MEDTIIQTKSISRRTKFAIFDFDWTLVKPQGGRIFPKAVADWQYIQKSVPKVLTKYGKSHHIVIVTDQSKPWKIEQIKSALEPLKLEHLTIIIGFRTHKPETTLFDKTFPKFKPENAFYVGDAAGRKNDWSDKDKLFAANLNVKFLTPEEIFPTDENA
jgi:bifunctional polynucleotide phosphatase/kinase